MKIKVDKISIQEKVSKAGKAYKSLGIKTGSEVALDLVERKNDDGSVWLNGFIGQYDAEWEQYLLTVNEGDEIEIAIKEGEYQGKKTYNVVKPNQVSAVAERLDALEKRVLALEGVGKPEQVEDDGLPF